MAEQDGIIPLIGTIDKLTFLKGTKGHLAKKKSTISKKKIAKDPAFERTRENNAEFGRAVKAGQLLRSSLRALTINASDRYMIGRMAQQMMKAIKADPVSLRGMRNMTNGKPELLKGFDFNADGKLGSTLKVQFTTEIDRVAGTLKVMLPPFVPMNMLPAPTGTTHFKINSAGIAIDFAESLYEVQTNASAILPWDRTNTAAINLTNTVSANSIHPLILVAGVEFYQEVNGLPSPLKSGIFNALAIVNVDVV